MTLSYAHERQVVTKGDSKKLWYTDEIHLARRKRRRLERKFNKTGLEIDRQLFEEQSRLVVHMIDNAKRDFYNLKFETADRKETFSLIDGLLGKNRPSHVPPGKSSQSLADQFAEAQRFHLGQQWYHGFSTKAWRYAATVCLWDNTRSPELISLLAALDWY